MLTISTIPEALGELDKSTGRVWTDSELFDLATCHGIELHAVPPITAIYTVREFAIGSGMVEKFRSPPGHAQLAVLFPFQIGQLWLGGETHTSQVHKQHCKEGEYHFFSEPVRVTREQVRIKAMTLKRILALWKRAQAGEEPKHRGPEWMFSAVPGITATSTPPAPVMAVGDGSAPLTKAPAWSLITSLGRAPGYRWPLYQFLKAAHAAGKPCPKARDVVDAWMLKPPPDVQAMPDGVKYNNSLGNQKEADLKAIQQAIKALLQKEAGQVPDKRRTRRPRAG